MTQGQPQKLIKILYIITQGEMGGAQQYVFDLATNLPSNFVAEVAMGVENIHLGKKLEARGIRVHYLTHLVRSINPVKDLLAINEIKKLIKTNKPEIVHLNSSKAGIVGSIAAHKAGIMNVIFTAHGLAFLEPNTWIIKLMYLWAEKFVKNYRKKIITISTFDKSHAVKSAIASEEQLVTIYNGIRDFETIPREESRQKLGIKADEIVIGTIANNYKTKDLKTLKKAFGLVSSQFKNLRLVIIGKGNEFGEISNAKKLLSAFDIYVISSVKEGHPYSLLEAMSAGLPIVSTNVGGVPDTIEGGVSGLLVKPNQPEQIALAIKKLLLDDKLTKTLAHNAKIRAKDFSLEKMIDKTVGVYEDCI